MCPNLEEDSKLWGDIRELCQCVNQENVCVPLSVDPDNSLTSHFLDPDNPDYDTNYEYTTLFLDPDSLHLSTFSNFAESDPESDILHPIDPPIPDNIHHSIQSDPTIFPTLVDLDNYLKSTSYDPDIDIMPPFCKDESLLKVFIDEETIHNENETSIPIMVAQERCTKEDSKEVPQPEIKGGQLWKFILQILCDKDHNPSCITWEDYERGIFRFVCRDTLTKLWAEKRNRPHMKYDFLARSIRHYYKKDVIVPVKVKHKRMVYKFGKNAIGWKSMVNTLLYSTE